MRTRPVLPVILLGLILLFSLSALQRPADDAALRLLTRLFRAAHPDAFYYGSSLFLVVVLSLGILVLVPGLLIIGYRALGRSRNRAKGGPSAGQMLRKTLFEVTLLLLVFSAASVSIYVSINRRLEAPVEPAVAADSGLRAPQPAVDDSWQAGGAEAAASPEQPLSQAMDRPSSGTQAFSRLLIPTLFVLAALLVSLVLYKPLVELVRQASQPAQDLARSAAEPNDTGAMLETLHKTKQRLDTGDSLRNSIIEAFAELTVLVGEEQEQAGTSTLTARELLRYFLAKGVSRDLAEGLIGLFERARYSNADCGAAERDQASRLLGQILSGLGSAGGERS